MVPHIPSLPISYIEAIPLLAALDGHGIPGTQVNRTRWIGALNVTYSTGPAPGAVLSMSNVMRDVITPVWDAIGIINGTSNEEAIVIGKSTVAECVQADKTAILTRAVRKPS